MAAILNGGAIIFWTLLITRKVVYGKVRLVVPVLVICGIGFIGIGISHIIDAVYPSSARTSKQGNALKQIAKKPVAYEQVS